MNVVLTLAAQAQLWGLPRVMQARIMEILERLGRWPAVSGAKPLSGRLAGRYRIRTGDYRVQFYVERTRVVVERIGHRDRFYEE